MRRDYFDIDVSGTEESSTDDPVIAIAFDGPDDLLSDRLTSDGGTLDAGELDVTYRTRADGSEAAGVLSIANRHNGEYVLEANVAPSVIESVVAAASDDEGTRYRLRLTDGDGKSTVYTKEILLVYDESGSLSRGRSLIPGGVEL
ncbi:MULTISPECIES: DUF5793 family protein [Halomicrobium]|uniref:Uncharacterized protein n=2 Tax=Halomicrobium mukohataei TaxID=57705 RepID=C7NZQ7_HALMD|nr:MULTISPECIES: DUF5793 family protein [Halomicrobium]ACV48825.1 conserved hypothetical protein [Halomicrobium mukohataei DSM 12286]QCD64257.1 hypothetical protein E5139_00900 [Halomicrobium mukohataei]QFR19063.1 hypothetical protein GBQ70_00900 [Halomicrobium sp. ZPS1]